MVAQPTTTIFPSPAVEKLTLTNKKLRDMLDALPDAKVIVHDAYGRTVDAAGVIYDSVAGTITIKSA